MNAITHRISATITAAIAATFLLVAFAPGCDAIPGVDWPTALHCGSRAADDLFPTVSGILLDGSGDSMSERGKRGLEDLALEHGADIVACLVDRLIQRWTAPGATTSPERSEAVTRAQAWQVDVGTEVQP